ncbi:MAG: hypothetical protein U0936_05600 [Planctomycetaceae bacterium]
MLRIWKKALDEAARLIRKARAPLFFGLSRSSTDGQRAVCELADRIGATIDAYHGIYRSWTIDRSVSERRRSPRRHWEKFGIAPT